MPLLLTLSLTLRILVSLLLTLNIFHEIYRNTARKVISSTDCKLKCFSSRIEVPPVSPNIDPSNLPFVRIYAQGVLTGFYGISSENFQKNKDKKKNQLRKQKKNKKVQINILLLEISISLN